MLFVKGKLEGIQRDVTKEGKPYQKMYFRQDFEKGGFGSMVVKDYGNTPCVIGDEIEAEVYTSAWVSSKGVAGVTLIAINGKVKVDHPKSEMRV